MRDSWPTKWLLLLQDMDCSHPIHGVQTKHLNIRQTLQSELEQASSHELMLAFWHSHVLPLAVWFCFSILSSFHLLTTFIIILIPKIS